MDIRASTVLALLAIAAPLVLAQNSRIDGIIQGLDPSARTLLVDGRLITTDHRTEYQDELDDFHDLRPGLRVGIIGVSEGAHWRASEIELAPRGDAIQKAR